MILRQLFDPETSTYTYLVADPVSRKAALIDPVATQMRRDRRLLAELGLELTYVIDTHTHADHVTASGRLADRTNARTVVSRNGPSCGDVRVAHDDRLALGELRLHILETPGHTDDSISVLVEDNVFTGDSLLIRKAGRTDFQNGDAHALYHSLTTVLFGLPDTTVVWPGHDYAGFTSSTIGEERRFNERVANRDEQAFVEVMDGLGLPPPARINEAVPANQRCGRPVETV